MVLIPQANGNPGSLSGFELYLNDGNTTSLLSFDSTGQLDSTQTLSDDERFAREISSGFDLNGDGITGISLNTEVLHGRLLTPKAPMPGPQPLCLSRQRRHRPHPQSSLLQ